MKCSNVVREFKNGKTSFLLLSLILAFIIGFLLISAVHGEEPGSITLDFTQFNDQMAMLKQSERPTYGIGATTTIRSTEFTSMNIKVVKVEDGIESIRWESNVTTFENITLALEPGTYKVYTQLEGDDTVLEYNNDSGGYVITQESDVVIPMVYPPLEDYILDVLWRIENSEFSIPILALDTGTNWADIYNITVYDANNADSLVESTNWESIQPIDGSNTPFFYLFNIDKSSFVQVDGEISIKIKFDLHWSFDVLEGPKNVKISQYDSPMMVDWYCGDTHLHTNYTHNLWEFGAPIYATRAANNAMGLDWMIVTDHSFDLDQETWNGSKEDFDAHSDEIFRVLQGEEVSCYLPTYFQYYHLLVYGSDFIPGGETELFIRYTPAEAISIANSQGGITYAAHPMYNDGIRPPWRDEDYNLPFTGLQVWNYGTNEPTHLPDGLAKWSELLLDGRHVYVEGGTDAHGDFNTIAGKVRTYVYTENFTEAGILDALRNGHSVMTDGPLVIFDINGEITGNSLNLTKGKTATLHMQWNSTPEFGYLNNITVKKGVINETDETTYNSSSPETRGKDNLSDEYNLTIASNKSCYYRIEASSKTASGETYECFTNPIWVDVVNDTTTPEVILTSPLNGSIVNVTNVTVIGYATDDVGIVSMCFAHFWDGGGGGGCKSVNISTNASINWTVSLYEGNNTLRIAAIDAANNSANVSLKVIRDTTAPEVTISAPLNGSIVNVSHVTVTGYATDDVGIVTMCHGVTHELGGGGGCGRLLNASTNISINWTASLDEGTNIITVSATDAAHNTANVSLTVIRDTTAPDVIITYPTNGSVVNISNVTVTGYATDDVGIVTMCYGVAHELGGGGGCGRLLNASTNISINWTASSLDEGTNIITVSATDAAHNTANVSVVVIYSRPDEEPPTSISNLSHTSGLTWINWTWTNPPDTDFNHTKVYLNGTWQANTSYPFFNATELDPGTSYEIATQTVDLVGNVNDTWVSQTAKTSSNTPPIAAFTYTPSNPVVNETVTFNASNSTDPDGVITNYQWQFGDGNATATSEFTIMHSYASAGTYTVNLTVTDNDGAANTTSKIVSVFPVLKANFTANNTCFCTNVTFSANVTGGKPPYTYRWDYDNDGVYELVMMGNYSNTTWHYDSPGTHTARLNVTDYNGYSNEITKSVMVYANPQADFEATSSCFCTETVFTDISVAGDGSITNWTWTFGDGEPAYYGEVITHHYPAPGVYQASLTVIDEYGCLNTVFKNVTVYENPIADFTATTVQVGEDTEFTSSVIGGTPPYTYSWEFGDGNTSTEANPSYRYTAPGTYTASLNVVDNFGCSDTFTKKVEVSIVPHTDVGVTTEIELSNSTEIAPYLPPGTDLSNAVVIKANVTDATPGNAADDAYTDITLNVGALDVATCQVFKEGSGFLSEVGDVTTLPTVKPPGEAKFARDVANNSVIVRLYVGDPLLGVVSLSSENVFDTGTGAYPSISGKYNGTIEPSRDIDVSTLYTYPCPGTGGHTESIELYENGGLMATGTWNGYQGDWHNISLTPAITLQAGHVYNYTIRMGSYPQIHHNRTLLTENGWINCTEFTDANGMTYDDWIPAITLF